MSKQSLGGIHNVLDGLLSPAVPPSVLPEVPRPVENHRAKAVKPIVTETPSLAIKARRGRPLGHSIPASQPKAKVTLWLSQPLVDSYRDWSWEARCQFSHLVERALEDYSQRERNRQSAGR